mgnify:CR=1 FL=1
MKLFVTDNELDVGAFGLKSMFGRSGIKYMMAHDGDVTKGIIKTDHLRSLIDLIVISSLIFLLLFITTS